MKHKSIRPAFFIILVLALSAPTLANIAQGSDSALAAGEHLAAAILVSWLAVALVGSVVDNYRAAVLRRVPPGRQPHRRHS